MNEKLPKLLAGEAVLEANGLPADVNELGEPVLGQLLATADGRLLMLTTTTPSNSLLPVQLAFDGDRLGGGSTRQNA
jgi:hypothetical protein